MDILTNFYWFVSVFKIPKTGFKTGKQRILYKTMGTSFFLTNCGKKKEKRLGQ